MEMNELLQTIAQLKADIDTLKKDLEDHGHCKVCGTMTTNVWEFDDDEEEYICSEECAEQYASEELDDEDNDFEEDQTENNDVVARSEEHHPFEQSGQPHL